MNSGQQGDRGGHSGSSRSSNSVGRECARDGAGRQPLQGFGEGKSATGGIMTARNLDGHIPMGRNKGPALLLGEEEMESADIEERQAVQRGEGLLMHAGEEIVPRLLKATTEKIPDMEKTDPGLLKATIEREKGVEDDGGENKGVTSSEKRSSRMGIEVQMGKEFMEKLTNGDEGGLTVPTRGNEPGGLGKINGKVIGSKGDGMTCQAVVKKAESTVNNLMAKRGSTKEK